MTTPNEPANIALARRVASVYVICAQYLDMVLGKQTEATICNHEIETYCVRYAIDKYGRRVSPSSMRRRWQELRKDQLERKDGNLLDELGIIVEPQPYHPSQSDRAFILRRAEVTK